MIISLRSSLTFIILLVLSGFCLSGQNKQSDKYRVVFYNAENLFDPFDDPSTNDNEYTPRGKSHWTMARLDQKVMMVYRALIAASDGTFPDVIGMAEIENLWIIEYLLKKTPLKEGNYGIIHKESPDPRGIDVALLYRKDRIIPVDYEFIPVRGNKAKHFASRDILHFKANIRKESIDFFVNHWPSRSGGYVETQQKRNLAAGILRHKLDSLLLVNPKSKFLLMGDFNATPDETCFTKILGASIEKENLASDKLINMARFWSKEKIGTIRSKGHWEIFDQFICSGNLIEGTGLQISPSETIICKESFLLEDDKRYLGKKPFRTYMGPIYHGGVSDHLPISSLLFFK
jgi:Endonuclease/Exonuclease/phosphatase family